MAAKFLASSPPTPPMVNIVTNRSFRQTTAAPPLPHSSPFSVLSSPKFLKNPPKKSTIRVQATVGDADRHREETHTVSSPSVEVIQFENPKAKQFINSGSLSTLGGSRMLEPVWISTFVPLDPLSRFTEMRHQLRDANIALDHLIDALSMFFGEGQALRDMHVGDQEIKLWLDMPGLTRDDFKLGVDVVNNLLVIIRKGRMDKAKDDGSWNYSKYDTLVHLPKDCELNKITAEFQDGVLCISVPKKKDGMKATETTKPPAPTANEGRLGEVKGIAL